ncbi:MAG: aminotransferase class III-fold pyridoxal phosphate-dependent enzyme, partial [Myxococcales bacterium]|nr:aminotransferase class III-fold pyridoxal phosphate-dependent enzyme [Myxococcales bacterium]
MKDNEEQGAGQRLYQRARQIIPGASQLLGKRAEMYLPDLWPAYYRAAKGAEVWDLDGRRYLDFTMVGIGTSVLGYADEDVEQAVMAAVRAGPMCTLNPPEEVALAELLLELHPWAEMVSYARTGGEVMAKAVRTARAATGRDKVAFSGYHGWHDWYLATNLGAGDALNGHLLPGLEPAGVPSGLAGSALPFAYNRLEELERIAAAHGDQLAAIVMEPVRSEGPAPGFLEAVRALADRLGAVLIFDEITCGFRMNTGGMHQLYGVEPDIVTYAKTMSNGFAMAAMMGKRSVMDAVQRTFISSAYWTERVGPAAALATVTKHRRIDAGRTVAEIGTRVQAAWREAADAAGLPIKVFGIPPLASFSIDHADAPALTTLFIQDMLDRGYLASDRFYATVCHTPEHVDGYVEAMGGAFQRCGEALARG